MQLSQLGALDPSQDGTPGSLYQVISDETFWENEARVAAVDLAVDTVDGKEVFVLASSISRVLLLSEEITSSSVDLAPYVGCFWSFLALFWSILGHFCYFSVIFGTFSAHFSYFSHSLYSSTPTERQFNMKMEQLADPRTLKSPLITLPLTTYPQLVDKCNELVHQVTWLCSIPDLPSSRLPIEGNPWSELSTDNGVTVFERVVNPSSFTSYMARGVVEASPAEVKFLIKHSKNRQLYDPMCREARLVDAVDEATSVVQLVNGKFGMTRDFVFMRHARSLVRRKRRYIGVKLRVIWGNLV